MSLAEGESFFQGQGASRLVSKDTVIPEFLADVDKRFAVWEPENHENTKTPLRSDKPTRKRMANQAIPGRPNPRNYRISATIRQFRSAQETTEREA